MITVVFLFLFSDEDFGLFYNMLTTDKFNPYKQKILWGSEFQNCEGIPRPKSSEISGLIIWLGLLFPCRSVWYWQIPSCAVVPITLNFVKMQIWLKSNKKFIEHFIKCRKIWLSFQWLHNNLRNVSNVWIYLKTNH